jgi:fucose permease
MSSNPFKRDQFTWLAYFMLAYFAYLQTATIGPLASFLRDELKLNYAEGALHGSAYAAGMILAGILGSTITRRWGRSATFWGGGAGMAAGALCLILGQSTLVTIPSTFVMGLLGTLLLSAINASLSDKHGPQRAIALTEANIAASISSTLAPLLLGGLAGIGLGWRAAILVAVLVWIVGTALTYRISIPANETVSQTTQHKAGKLPTAFWIFWSLGALGGALEAGIGFWGATLLNKTAGMPLETASGLVSVMFAAMVVGRIVGSRLTRRYNTSKLLLSTIIIVVVGFPIFWLATVPLLNVVGLFIVGLGIANLFPLALSASTSAAAAQSDTATAYISLGAGVSILVVPQVIGLIADQVGIHTAFAFIGVIVITILVIALVSVRRDITTRKISTTETEAVTPL